MGERKESDKSKCSKCDSKAVTYIRYSGARLCASHFSEYFETRVKKEFRRQIDLKNGDRIAVAVSGGKDSTIALYTIHKILAPNRSVDIHAIQVDEGISSYRPHAIPIVKENCKAWNVEYHLVSFKDELGMTMDEIAPNIKEGELSACSFCGVFRRFCMNKAAREVGATMLATGHNLDDISQSIIMNITRGDVERLARLGPHTSRTIPGLIPRLLPLRAIPEKENYLYAMLNNIRFHEAECPYYEDALRNKYRKLVYDLERDMPGTRHSILQSYDAMKDALSSKYPPAELNKCEKCSEPTSHSICKRCELVEKAHSIVRRRLPA